MNKDELEEEIENVTLLYEDLGEVDFSRIDTDNGLNIKLHRGEFHILLRGMDKYLWYLQSELEGWKNKTEEVCKEDFDFLGKITEVGIESGKEGEKLKREIMDSQDKVSREFFKWKREGNIIKELIKDEN